MVIIHTLLFLIASLTVLAHNPNHPDHSNDPNDSNDSNDSNNLNDPNNEPNNHASKAPTSPIHMILDLDASGLLEEGLDVDDDLTALLAIASAKRGDISLLGITTTFGNAPASHTFANMLALRDMLGRPDLPVLRGPDFDSASLDEETEASRFIVEQVRAHANQSVVVVAVGPMGNLATALVLAPDIQARLGGIVMMGGDLRPARFVHIDMNFLAYREATRVVLGANVPKLLATVQTCIQVVFTPKHRQYIAEQCCPGAAVCMYLDKFDQRFGSLLRRLIERVFDGPGYDMKGQEARHGFFPWDLVALAAFLLPDHFKNFTQYRMGIEGFTTRSTPLGPSPPLIFGASKRQHNHSGVVVVPGRVPAAEALLVSLLDRICEVPSRSAPLGVIDVPPAPFGPLVRAVFVGLIMLLAGLGVGLICCCRRMKHKGD